MKLLNQILGEYGADLNGSITLIPEFGVYLANVKKVLDFSPQSVQIICGKKRIKIIGKNLSVGKYFQSDLLILGDVTGVSFE